LPGIFEHGCGLYFPQRELRHGCVYHPAALRAGPVRQRWEELAARITAETGAGRQCAKGALVTFFPPAGKPAAALAEYVAGLVAEAGLPLTVGHTFTSVDVTPQGIDKGSGLRWLLDELRLEGWDIDLAQVAAVGDSPSDICFMEIAGFSAAPANAAPPVQAMAAYISPQPHTRGVLDILQRVIARNAG
jgi:hydroxymethylpyrimidine pyrophosphatase-like HAD family hydrolase